MFESLLTRPALKADSRLAALLHSDIVRLVKSINNDFPEITNINSIGKSFLQRDILSLEIDAREFLVKKHANEAQLSQGLHSHYKAQADSALKDAKEELEKHYH